MIVIENTIVSDDIAEKFFVCNIEKCKGACCIEGDAGAPLLAEERQILEDIYDTVAPFLTAKGREAIEKQGTWVIDQEGDFSTPTIGGRECAYALYDQKGVLKCGIELAHKAGKIDYKKPISCHLYPIRIKEYEHYQAVNYDSWHICRDACHLGKDLGVPVYQFLKEPLIRKYGAEWYEQLEQAIAFKDRK
ncbi:Protein of unknown function [Flexibacter flexilis DSM 6793]|uniref:DUF3109 family protein n=1 Tax=Flexibacter flexilis DSM 6793 TaxID=927664 RepID=A0A1I1KIS4_9BACT|nr:DUF3109 family protein [Flexibacter flexilis]SFC60162.1 Protein of unknown function [Flexibacter flexilis DSM 6793]